MGRRPPAGELLDLTVGDLSDHKHGLHLSVDGKHGQRSVMLITAVPHLRQWLSEHPRRDDPGAPLWCTLQSGEDISYQMARKAVREAARRAGVSKPVNFTKFRASSASSLASQGVTQAVLASHHGWKIGSAIAGRYVSVFSEASDREGARAHGADLSAEEVEPIAAVTCPRCGRKTPRHEPFCMWCHQALEHDAKADLDEEQSEQRRMFLSFVKENPELVDKAGDVEPLIEMFGGDPEILQVAREFREALGES